MTTPEVTTGQVAVVGQPPLVDPRDYQQLLDEALARIPVHNPEWTNFNRSDPGVTLLELFAFLTEALLYRANQIPERNRRRLLSLLGVPAAPASSARGLVALANERGEAATVTLDAGLDLLAGDVPFRTSTGLDVLPVEGMAVVKQPVAEPDPDLVTHYRALYASYLGQGPEAGDVRLYRTTPVAAFGATGVALAATADSSLWIALLLREGELPARETVRRTLAGTTVNLGIVPVLADPRVRLTPAASGVAAPTPLTVELPASGLLPADPAGRVARYTALPVVGGTDVLAEPGVLQVELPGDPDALTTWTDLEPIEAGAGDFPPDLADSTVEERLLTWLRVRVPAGSEAVVQWVGINAVPVSQRAHVAGEVLPDGTGEPDQLATLTRTPVLAGSVTVEVTPPGGDPQTWHEIDDLLAAGPEVVARDPRTPPGARPAPSRDASVFTVDATTGAVRFGDGIRGRRPPRGATVRGTYDVGAGAAGNLGVGAVNRAPTLPGSFTVTNPIPTWGGSDAEPVREAERQAARYLQHRDRLVTAADFEAITRRTPGVELGRVDVLPTFHPDLAPASPTPGVVTLLVVPRHDARHPQAPEPDALFLDTICRHLDPRRLVTTELYLRGPVYIDLWVSIGIEVEAGRSIAAVREATRAALTRFLAPIDPDAPLWFEDQPAAFAQDLGAHVTRGWPLGKAVNRLELAAVAGRVPGVRLVSDVNVAAGTSGAVEQVPINGLQLPRVRAVAVGQNAADLDVVRGQQAPPAPPPALPVPVVPDTC